MEIFTFKEGKHWIAAWRRYDIVAQGGTEMHALHRLNKTILAHCFSDAEEGIVPFSNCPKPPAELIVEWQQRHERDHKSLN